MNYHKITKFDIANGPGIRSVLWVSGCSHRCKGCHNPQTWSASSGDLFERDALHELLDSLKPDYVAGLTLSGGDPLYPSNLAAIRDIVEVVKGIYPKKTIWLYTGFVYETIMANTSINEDLAYIMNNIDVIVDGKFEISNKDITLPYCGSSNQRVIDVQATISSGEINLYQGGN